MSIQTSGTPDPLRPGKIKKGQLMKMVAAYRKNPDGGDDGKGHKREATKFTHFTLPQVISFLIDNGLVQPDQTMESVLNDLSHGVKIYFSQHVDKEDCPPDYENYIGRNTVVLVGTVFNTATQKWDDTLRDETAPQLLSLGATEPESYAADKGVICPPQCPQFGETQ